jgi:Domain of unknown function (DUF4375)
MSLAEQAWADVCNRLSEIGYDSLAPIERDWVNLRSLIDSIENGGLISYFYNSGANHLADCLEALRRIDAPRALHEVQRVCALFPGGVPANIDDRNDLINSWADSPKNEEIDTLLKDVDDRLMPMMEGLETQLSGLLKHNGVAI